MKPTPQTNQNMNARPSFPFTDCNYQPTSDASCAATDKKRGAHRLHGFWKLSAEFHADEAVRHDATDFIVFTIMGVFCAWPIVSVIVAISRALNGY